MSGADEQITAIVVAHQSAAILPKCLESMRGAGLSAIVVDNASTDDTAKVAETFGATVLRNQKNEGFGRAHNLGVAAAASPYCLLLNPDISFAADAPQRLLRTMNAAPSAVLAGPALIEDDGRVFELSASPINPPRTDGQSVLSGAALLVRRDAFLQFGGFDPNIFLFWEDNDLCRRIVDSGADLLWARDVEMRHVRGGSSAPAPERTYKMRWHQAWSRFYVFAKYGVASDIDAWRGRFSRKLLAARLLGDRERQARYQGSLDGATAFQRGETALAHEGLS